MSEINIHSSRTLSFNVGNLMSETRGPIKSERLILPHFRV